MFKPLLVSAAAAQSTTFEKIAAVADTVKKAVDPLLDPVKVGEGSIERGIPVLHAELGKY